MTENQQDKTLQSYRAQIDKIDDQIIALLEERMGVVSNVAELKKNNNEKFFVKSAREADMIKNLLKKVGKTFPPATIVNIWRKIITSANMHEQKITVAIHNPKDVSDYEYLVKEYYSESVPVINSDSANNVVLELQNNVAQIAVFALPNEFDDSQSHKEELRENWWVTLANNKIGLRIFAKIPFVEFTKKDKSYNQIQLVAAAIKEPEKSESDSSLLYVELDSKFSRGELVSVLKNNGFTAKILKSVQMSQFSGMTFYLVEAEGFYLENDASILALKKSKISAFVKILGHFANPIKL